MNFYNNPKVTHIKSDSSKSVPWKNGLGETRGIFVQPPSNQADNFTWKLALSVAHHDCSFSLIPGYDVALLQLPNGDDDWPNTNFTLINHNDHESSVQWKPLVPYTYNGDWPTTCRASTDVTFALETICRLGLTDDGVGEKDGDGDTDNEASQAEAGQKLKPTAKILLGKFTIVFVVKGCIQVQIENETSHRVVSEGETLIVERNEEDEPTDFAMSPVSSMKDLYESLPTSSENSGLKSDHINKHMRSISAGLTINQDELVGNEDATVFIIQVNLRTDHRKMSSTWELPKLNPPPERRGSVIIYDDQPFWPLPESGNTSTADLSGATANHSSIHHTPHQNLTTKYWESARHYRPPIFSARYVNESEVPPPIVRDTLVIEEFPVGRISTAWINMVKQGLSEWIKIPVIIARGIEEGPIVGITAVVHGNELNGVPCIHRVITDIDVNRLKGTVVAVPCVNVPGYLRFSREFSDGKDLNRLFPGQESGTASQIYAYNFLTKIVEKFNVLIDLHTASFGRVNSYYVRSDMNDPGSAILAKLQQPQIILHNSGQDGTLRSAASARGIKAITVEIGNPQLFQNQYVQWSYMGVMSILAYLGMFSSPSPDWAPGVAEELQKAANLKNKEDGGGNHDEAAAAKDSVRNFPLMPTPSTVFCSKGFWIYTKTGGVLEVYPGVNTIVKKGALIARIKNIFGNIVDEIFSPASGITIGRSSNPVAMAGDRVLHLGVIKKEGEALPKEAKENY